MNNLGWRTGSSLGSIETLTPNTTALSVKRIPSKKANWIIIVIMPVTVKVWVDSTYDVCSYIRSLAWAAVTFARNWAI